MNSRLKEFQDAPPYEMPWRPGQLVYNDGPHSWFVYRVNKDGTYDVWNPVTEETFYNVSEDAMDLLSDNAGGEVTEATRDDFDWWPYISSIRASSKNLAIFTHSRSSPMLP